MTDIINIDEEKQWTQYSWPWVFDVNLDAFNFGFMLVDILTNVCEILNIGLRSDPSRTCLTSFLRNSFNLVGIFDLIGVVGNDLKFDCICCRLDIYVSSLSGSGLRSTSPEHNCIKARLNRTHTRSNRGHWCEPEDWLRFVPGSCFRHAKDANSGTINAQLNTHGLGSALCSQLKKQTKWSRTRYLDKLRSVHLVKLGSKSHFGLVSGWFYSDCSGNVRSTWVQAANRWSALREHFAHASSLCLASSAVETAWHGFENDWLRRGMVLSWQT